MDSRSCRITLHPRVSKKLVSMYEEICGDLAYDYKPGKELDAPDIIVRKQIEAFCEYIGNLMISTISIGVNATMAMRSYAVAEDVIESYFDNDDDLADDIGYDWMDNICPLMDTVLEKAIDDGSTYVEAWTMLQARIMPCDEDVEKLLKDFERTANHRLIENHTSGLFVRFKRNFDAIVIQ